MSTDLQERLENTTIAQWQARQIEKAAHIMSVFVESSTPEKLKWRPAVDENSKTTSILDQVGECVFANRRFRSILLEEPLPVVPDEFDTFSSTEDALSQLQASAKALADLVRTLDSAALAKGYNSHRGFMPGALAIQLPVRNMTYHMGQINMIQLLYGDKEFHIDVEFLTL